VYKLFHLLNIFRLSDDRLKIDEESDNDDQKEVVNKIKELLNTKIKETANDVDGNVDDSTTMTTVKDEEETTTLLPAELVRAAETTATTPTPATPAPTPATIPTPATTPEYIPPPPPPEEPQQPAANPGIFARVGEFFSSITNFGFRPVVIGRK
jgi:hypothetical protein